MATVAQTLSSTMPTTPTEVSHGVQTHTQYNGSTALLFLYYYIGFQSHYKCPCQCRGQQDNKAIFILSLSNEMIKKLKQTAKDVTSTVCCVHCSEEHRQQKQCLVVLFPSLSFTLTASIVTGLPLAGQVALQLALYSN